MGGEKVGHGPLAAPSLGIMIRRVTGWVKREIAAGWKGRLKPVSTGFRVRHRPVLQGWFRDDTSPYTKGVSTSFCVWLKPWSRSPLKRAHQWGCLACGTGPEGPAWDRAKPAEAGFWTLLKRFLPDLDFGHAVGEILARRSTVHVRLVARPSWP